MKIKKFIRGDTRAINVTVTDSAGAAVDLTGGTVFFTLNASSDPTDDTDAVVEKSVTSHTDPTHGLTTITLDHADTDSLAADIYYYDIQFVDAQGNVTSKQADTFEIIADITRRTS